MHLQTNFQNWDTIYNKDQQNSANLAGFGIPNYLFSCEVFVKSIDYEKARMLCKD